MYLIKKINNNFAIARDSVGKVIIVSGRGIGFEKMPCELKDLARIDRTYYDVDNRFVTQIQNIPDQVINLTTKAVAYASTQLNRELNPNLFFTLADHINFVIDRAKSGIHFNYGITYEVRYLHLKEMEIAESILVQINKLYQLDLSIDEAAIIALHILEAEKLTPSVEIGHELQRILLDIGAILTRLLRIELDDKGFNYYRFVSHIQYLMDRRESKTAIVSANQKIFDSLTKEFPDTYQCVLEIKEYFIRELNWTISDEELLYLMLHINRLCSKEDCNQ
jgi:beta-glucoside operon transcriptional antiterminator